MTLYELLNKHKYHKDEIISLIWNLFYADDEDDLLIDEGLTFGLFSEKAQGFYDYLLSLSPSENTNDVIFVLKQLSTWFGEDSIEYKTFKCKKDEIEQVISNDFVMWNNDGIRLEHYDYISNKSEDVISFECFFDDCDEKTVLAVILDELSIFGWNERERNDRISQIDSILKGSYKSIKAQKDAGETIGIPAEEALSRIHEKIYQSADEEEKAKIREEREEKEQNKERDNLYLRIAMRINHKACISLVEKYYLHSMLLK